jgi:hypothetical protein
VKQGFFGVQAGQMYALTWKAPKKQKGVFSYCVTLADRRGKKSQPSCALIDLR